MAQQRMSEERWGKPWWVTSQRSSVDRSPGRFSDMTRIDLITRCVRCDLTVVTTYRVDKDLKLTGNSDESFELRRSLSELNRAVMIDKHQPSFEKAHSEDECRIEWVRRCGVVSRKVHRGSLIDDGEVIE